MKKFFVFLPILVASFFLLLSNVKADEYLPLDTQYISNFSFIENTRNKAIELSSQNNSYYVILPNSGSSFYIYLFPSLSSYSFVFNHYSSYDCYTFKFVNMDNQIIQYTFDTNSNLTYRSNKTVVSYEFQIKNNKFYYNLIDTNFDFIYSNLSSSYSFSYDNDVYTIQNDNPYLTLYYIYQYSNGLIDPPTPPDNTPILTDFINISIEKLSLICNFITSSYIYLTPFVILIFYIVILLFRRFR